MTIFEAGVFAAVGAGLLTFCEVVAAWRFVPQVFGWGLVMLRESRRLTQASLAERVETESGTFKRVSPDVVLFRAHMGPFPPRPQTFCSLRGRIRWQRDQCQVECRTALFPLVLVGSLLLAQTAFVGLALSVRHARFIALGLLGFSFLAALLASSVWIERRRARRLLAELERALRA